MLLERGHGLSVRAPRSVGANLGQGRCFRIGEWYTRRAVQCAEHGLVIELARRPRGAHASEDSAAPGRGLGEAATGGTKPAGGRQPKWT